MLIISIETVTEAGTTYTKTYTTTSVVETEVPTTCKLPMEKASCLAEIIDLMLLDYATVTGPSETTW
jgi:hypothetical protein